MNDGFEIGQDFIFIHLSLGSITWCLDLILNILAFMLAIIGLALQIDKSMLLLLTFFLIFKLQTQQCFLKGLCLFNFSVGKQCDELRTEKLKTYLKKFDMIYHQIIFSDLKYGHEFHSAPLHRKCK